MAPGTPTPFRAPGHHMGSPGSGLYTGKAALNLASGVPAKVLDMWEASRTFYQRNATEGPLSLEAQRAVQVALPGLLACDATKESETAVSGPAALQDEAGNDHGRPGRQWAPHG